jgi:hypothetical protein
MNAKPADARHEQTHQRSSTEKRIKNSSSMTATKRKPPGIEEDEERRLQPAATAADTYLNDALVFGVARALECHVCNLSSLSDDENFHDLRHLTASQHRCVH